MHHAHIGRVAIWALAAALTVTSCADEGPTGGAAGGVRQGDVVISEQPDPSETTPSSLTPTPAVTARAGEPTKYVGETTDPISDESVDYEVTITVSGAECGTQTIQAEYRDPVTATLGEFCVARFEVRNTGLIPVSFSPGQSSLVDSAGRTFSVHSDATSVLTDAEDRESFPTINPTGSAEMALVFDIPADSTPTLLHLRNGFQTGVDFALG